MAKTDFRRSFEQNERVESCQPLHNLRSQPGLIGNFLQEILHEMEAFSSKTGSCLICCLVYCSLLRFLIEVNDFSTLFACSRYLIHQAQPNQEVLLSEKLAFTDGETKQKEPSVLNRDRLGQITAGAQLGDESTNFPAKEESSISSALEVDNETEYVSTTTDHMERSNYAPRGQPRKPSLLPYQNSRSWNIELGANNDKSKVVRILTVTDNALEELQFHNEECVADEGPFKTLDL